MQYQNISSFFLMPTKMSSSSQSIFQQVIALIDFYNIIGFSYHKLLKSLERAMNRDSESCLHFLWRLILSPPSWSSWRLLRWIIRTHTVDFQINEEKHNCSYHGWCFFDQGSPTIINLRYLHLNEHKAWRLRSWYPAEINHWHIISYFISLFRTCEMKTIPS